MDILFNIICLTLFSLKMNQNLEEVEKNKLRQNERLYSIVRLLAVFLIHACKLRLLVLLSQADLTLKEEWYDQWRICCYGLLCVHGIGRGWSLRVGGWGSILKSISHIAGTLLKMSAVDLGGFSYCVELQGALKRWILSTQDGSRYQ